MFLLILIKVGSRTAGYQHHNGRIVLLSQMKRTVTREFKGIFNLLFLSHFITLLGEILYSEWSETAFSGQI